MFENETCDKKKARDSRSRPARRRGVSASNTGDPVPDYDAADARREAVAAFAFRCRSPGEWDFDGGDLIPVLLTKLPAWQRNGLVLEILQEGRKPVILGSGNEDLIVRPVIRLRRVNDSHYKAIINGVDVDLGADGNCFFYSIWYALENGVSPEIRQQIYDENVPSNKFHAAAFLRNEIADYSLAHEDEIADSLTYCQPETAARMKPGDRKPGTASANPENSAPDSGESKAIPFDLKEIPRALFHTGKALSSAVGWSWLAGEGWRTLFQWLPLNQWPFQVWFAYEALVLKREYFEGFLNVLSMLPYNALSSEHFLFSVADAARQIYHPLLSGIDDVPPFFWTAVGALAFATHYRFFARLDVDLPQTRIGQTATAAATASLWQLRRIPQICRVFETINSVVHPSVMGEHGDRWKMTPAERRSDLRARKLLRAEGLAELRLKRTAFASQPAPNPDNTFTDIAPEQQHPGQTVRKFVCVSPGNSADASSDGLNASTMATRETPAGTAPERSAVANAKSPNPAALNATLNIANSSVHELSREPSSLQTEENFASHPRGSVTSDAPETKPFITLPIAAAGAVVTHGRLSAIWPPGRYTVISAVSIVTTAAIVGYVVQLALSLREESDDTDFEISEPDAQALSQEYPDTNADLQTPNFKWLYLGGRNLQCVKYFIETQFDHQFFVDALVAVFAPDNKNQPGESEKTIYETAIRRTWGDYISDFRDVRTPLRYRSSEDRYGAELYSIIEQINLVDNCVPEGVQLLKSILIKIKTYETFILRERKGLHFDSKEGVIAKLESIFGFPIELAENAISTEALDDYVATQLGYDSTISAPDEVANGVRTAISAWTNATTRFFEDKSGIPEAAISASRQSIADRIREEKEEVYTLRGPRDGDRFKRSKRKLAEYRYAARYLENHIKLSHNFLEILNEIEPALQKIKPQLPTLSRTRGDAIVLYARALAVKAALKMLGKHPQSANSDNQADLENLSDIDYLNNFPSLAGSSPEVAAFISFAEAIFFRALTRLEVENFHLFAKDPTELIKDFKIGVEKSPIYDRNGTVAQEGKEFIKNITTSDKTFDDTEYYKQFSDFKSKYKKAVANLLSYFALLKYGFHPYRMLTEKPLRAVQMTLYMRAKLPPAQKPSAGYLYLQFLNFISDSSQLKFNYAKAGELIFCEMPGKYWIVISTLGGSCVVKSVSAARMNQNQVFKEISLEEGFLGTDDEETFGGLLDQIPHGSHEWWMDENMIEYVIRPIFGNELAIDKNSFEKAYLSLNKKTKRNFKDKSILKIADEAADDFLENTMEQTKEAKYKKAFWQYLTTYIPGFDIGYRSAHDPHYKPSAGEISLEVLSGVLTLISIGIPVGQLTAASEKLLRASLLKNLAKGLRGPALLQAVWAEVGSNLALFPLRVFAISGYEIFAFWQPAPLDTVVKSLYKYIRNLKFDFKFKKIKAKTLPNPIIRRLDPDALDVTKSGNPVPAEARGLLMSLHESDIRFYEYSYRYAEETPLGTGKFPDADVAAPIKPKEGLPLANSHALNDEGAIELSSSRAITRIETPFHYSRTDATASPKAISSLGSEGRHLTFESMEQGIARDIEFHRQSSAPFGYGSDLGINSNTEVVLLRDTTDSAVGIRVDLENIAPDRPLLITSGDMSGGTFLAGIDKEDACVYFYRLGDIGSNSADPASDNIAIRRLFQTHNSLATRAEMRISIPESAQKTDLLWFSTKFDKTMVTYADDSRTSGFTVLDQDFDLSAQPGATPPTSHVASSSALDLLDFNRAPGDINIIQRSGNAYYLLSRTDDDHVSIIGTAQYRGSVDTSQPKPWQPGADGGKGYEIATSDIRQIVDLLVKSGNRVSSHIRILDPDHLKAIGAAGKYFLAKGYNVKYRITILWPSKESDEIIQHYVPIVETNGRTYLVDILAGRFSSQGINEPIYATDSSWISQYISSFSDRVILIRDINSFDSLENLVQIGPVRKTLASQLLDPDWILLNKPSWTLLKASEITEAINTNIIIDIGASRTQRSYLDSNPVVPLPSLPLERMGKWSRITNEQGFTGALAGSPTVAMAKIQTFLIDKNIESKIIMSKTYENFHDENPTTGYAIKAQLQDEPADVITLRLERSGDAFGLVGVVPLAQWQSENRHKITFYRLIDDPRTIPDFLDAGNAPEEIGQSHFFNEMTNRYSLMHFDPEAMSSLEDAIARTRAEMDKYSGPYLNNDLRTERSILDQYRSQGIKNQMDIRVQQTRVDDISNYQFLRGLHGRLEDLQGKIRAGNPGDIQPQGNPGKRMIGKVTDLQASALKSIIFKKVSVKKYDRSTGKYLTDAGFVVVNVPDLKYLFGEVELNKILTEYLKIYKEIYDMAIAYSVEGRLKQGQDIVKNSYHGIEMTERLIRYSDLGYTESVYALIDRNNFNFQSPSVYGLSLVLHAFEKDEILHLDTVVAHPFTQLRNEQDFTDYAIRHGAQWSQQMLDRYRTEGVGRFLSYQTAKNSLGPSDAKYISMQARNPRAENIASAFGLKEMNDLEFYGLDVSLKAGNDARRSLLRAIFHTVVSKSEAKPGPVPKPAEIAGPVVKSDEMPVSRPDGSLDIQWRREDVSLNSETPAGPGDRFEGIYSVPVAGSSTSADEWKYYIKEGDNTYEVRWDDDAHTWRIVNPLDPGIFGNAPPVRLDGTGRWVTHTDIPAKESVPLSSVGKVGHLIDLSESQSREMRSIVGSGRKRALNIIKDALKALSRKETEDVDDAMDIFFGRHNDAAKDIYRRTLTDIQDFLKKLDVIDDIFYKGGYFSKKTTLMYTRVNSALTNWKEGPPPIFVSVDALADASLRKSFTLTELENFVGCILIHESYHAVSSAAKDLSYASLSDGAFDISALILLRDPHWFGDDDLAIMSKYGVSRQVLMDRRETSYRRAVKNPDNLAYLTVLLSTISDRNPWYGKFITGYDRWLMDTNSALEWKHKGGEKGGPLRLNTRTAIASLVNRDPTPLLQNGLLYRTSSSEILVDFYAITPSSPNLQRFTLENRVFSDFLDTWEGGKTTSQKNEVWSGTWGNEHFLNDFFSVIEIRGEKSATAAIRINLDDLEEGYSLIVSGGELAGSTLAFALSRQDQEQYLYVFHAGYRSGDPNWQPSQQGIAGIYQAHLSMGGQPMPGLVISDTGVLVDQGGTPWGHRALCRILEKYEQGFVAYSGQLPNSSPGDLSMETPLDWVDYAAGKTGSTPGRGYAYALLTKQDGKVKMTTRAIDAQSVQASTGAKPKKPKT